jgi:hypothetical protein
MLPNAPELRTVASGIAFLFDAVRFRLCSEYQRYPVCSAVGGLGQCRTTGGYADDTGG